jgi:hypothetical protein
MLSVSDAISVMRTAAPPVPILSTSPYRLEMLSMHLAMACASRALSEQSLPPLLRFL